MEDLKSKTSPNFSTCSFCGEKIEKPVFENISKFGNKYDVFECLTCEMWITKPKPSYEQLSKLYSTGNYRAKTGKRFVSILSEVVSVAFVLALPLVQLSAL